MQNDSILIQSAVEKMHMPENLRIGMRVAEQREKCKKVKCDCDYYGFAFGQSPFPVPSLLKRTPCFRQTLARASNSPPAAARFPASRRQCPRVVFIFYWIFKNLRKRFKKMD